jgi:hypothetical protein
MTEFRNLPPTELWSATLHSGKELSTKYDEFYDTTRNLSLELNQRFSGFITMTGDRVNTFTRTRYPRKKYGTPTLDELAHSTEALAARLGATMQIDRVRGNFFRVVLGLLEGYDQQAPVHDLEEVRHALGGTSLRAIPAKVFSTRPDGQGNCPVYVEPCAVITGDTGDLPVVYDLADNLRQERFTVEDFSNSQVYVVETSHCAEPDT